MGVKMRKPPQGPGLRRINMKIGEAERRTGLAASAIRFYEDEGLLTPKRSKKGTRLYCEADLAHLAVLRELTEGGASLEFLKVLVRVPATSGTGDEAAHKAVYHLTRLRAALTKKRDAMTLAIERLERAEEEARRCFRCKLKPGGETCEGCLMGTLRPL